MKIRFAKASDAAALREIYAPYVEETAISYEYQVPSEEEFRSRIETVLEKFPYLVAEEDGIIYGYAYASVFKPPPAYDWTVETSIYLRRDVLGKGLGSRLYSALEDILQLQGICSLIAVVTCPDDDTRQTGSDSLDFHRRRGYETLCIFHSCGYKFGRWHDTAWLEKRIAPSCGDMKPPTNIAALKDEIHLRFGIE